MRSQLRAAPMPNGNRVGRRTVAKGLAWSVPAVAAVAATPAYAASGCVVKTNFDGLTVGTCPSQLTFAPSTITGTISYVANHGTTHTPGGTCQVARTSGPNGWNYIEVEMVSPLVEGDTITVTIALTQAVENLSFTIHDIDGVQGAWRDSVIVNTTGYTYQRGSNIRGIGVATGGGVNNGPFRPTNWGDTPISEGAGDVRLTWAGPIQSVTFTYRARDTGNSQNQHIGIGNIRFTDCVVPSGRLGPASARLAAEPLVSTGIPTTISLDGSHDL